MFYKIRLTIAILIFITAILALLGIFYPLHLFDIQIAPLIQRVIIDFSIISAVSIGILLLLTILFGRIYCTTLCPFGILQELIAFFRGKGKEKTRKNLPVKYFITAIAFGIMIGGSAIIIRYIEPYTYFGSAVTLSVIGIIAVITIIMLSIFKNRYFCTNICPVGCLLGLLSKISLFKIYIKEDDCLSCGMCERNCPSGSIEVNKAKVDNETCVKCFKCLNLCPKNAVTYGIKPKEEVKFSLKRRELITFSAALVIFAGAIKAGIEIGKTAAGKIKNIILPAGAIDAQRMFNKCLNCNLCINACPNKILTKADKDFGAVHIDYTKGEKYCKYDCRECAKVCPSGAIKKIPLNEKQKTRIAMAVINPDKCTKNGVCINVCPVHAITMEENQSAKVDASKCIGCGRCKTVCNSGAVEIFAINEQQRV